MVDPLTIGGALAAAGSSAPSWLPWAAAGASAGAGLGASLLSGKGAAPQVNIPTPPGVAPAQTPNAKPARKSQQQSFLSGAAMAQQTGGVAQGTGKSLLGA